MRIKGIIMAGGKGTRLLPATKVISKHLLPIYDKPMIYYPLSTLMLSNIRDILIISSPRDLPLIEKLLGDGSNFGIRISYKYQEEPNGVAEGLIIGKDFLKDSCCALILGDNIFFGNLLQHKLEKAIKENRGATIFSYHVNEPTRFAIVETNNKHEPLSIEEKPHFPKSDLAVTGLYFYDKNASLYASELITSIRNEYEISDLNNIYLKKGKLKVEELSRGFTWIDAGTHKSFIEASQLIYTLENRQGLKISCPEEIALYKGWITGSQLFDQTKDIKSTNYGKYIMKILKNIN